MLAEHAGGDEGPAHIDAAERNDPTNLVMLVVLAIVGFTATVVAARFMETDAPVEEAV